MLYLLVLMKNISKGYILFLIKLNKKQKSNCSEIKNKLVKGSARKVLSGELCQWVFNYGKIKVYDF